MATAERWNEPTPNGSTYVRPQDMDWKPTRFEGISIKVLYEDRDKGEMTCLLKWEPGASLPFHRHPEIEQRLRHRRLVPRPRRHRAQRRRVRLAASGLAPRDPLRRGGA